MAQIIAGDKSPIEDFPSELLKEMSEHYRQIRKRVFEEATLPLTKSNIEHQKHQRLFRSWIEKVCNDANLSLYIGNSESVARQIWYNLWTKNRYANIQANIASTEIEGIKSVFDDYEAFSSPDWDIEIERQPRWNAKKKQNTPQFVVVRSGRRVADFLNRKGDFKAAKTIGNLPKLRTIVDVARKLKRFMDSKSESTPPLEFVTRGNSHDDIWTIHNHLVEQVGYRGDLTALHFMMDIGFPVIKPDIVISNLFYSWEWLNRILVEPISNIRELEKSYTKPKVYKPVIDLSQQIVNVTSQDDLLRDIGWVTQNRLREFDLFMVKFGQEPEPQYGIIRKLQKLQNYTSSP